VSGAARPGIPFVVAAPSGTGKTTVCRRLVARDPRIVFSVSHTTRLPRSGEVDGRDYHFVAAAEFTRLVREGAFLEWAEYNGNRYGTSFRAVQDPLASGRDVLLEIEVQGARQVRQRLPGARLIFVYPPSLAELRQRLERRGSNAPDDVERRLRTAEFELAALPEFDYAVLNDELERCVDCVQEILAAEREAEAAVLRATRERYAVRGAQQRLREREGRAAGQAPGE